MATWIWTICGVIAIALAPPFAVRIARKRRAEAAEEQAEEQAGEG
ncbi:MAG TPA: hypothetical protein VGL93_03745 [Streptosporangiaceae bacterium]|jgi:hypothetical protein